MAYNQIPSDWIKVGKGLKKSLFQYIRDNLIDHESRINSIETNAEKIEIFNFEVMGFINHYKPIELEQIGTYIANTNVTITEVRIILLNGASSPATSTNGRLAIDLKKGTRVNDHDTPEYSVDWSDTILEDYPEIPSGQNTTGYTSLAVNFKPGQNTLSPEDLLRVDIIDKKAIQGSFLIEVYGEIN